MTIIIRQNTTISSNTIYSEPIQIASGVTVTVMPGITLDLGGNSILLAGNLILSGTTSQFAFLSNGKISTQDTSGVIQGVNAKLTNITVDDFFSKGSISLSSCIVESSTIEPLLSSTFESDLFRNSQIIASGTKNASISNSTFIDSPISLSAWTPPFWGALKISNSNFIGTGTVIALDPFFSGQGFSHHITISNSYIAGVTTSQVDSKIFDADDDIRIVTDITPASFKNTPYTNDPKGFVVGKETIGLQQLGVLNNSVVLTGTSGNDTLKGGAGNDTIDGGLGADTVIYSGKIANYTIKKSGSIYQVQDKLSADGTDLVTNVETLRFSDMTVNLSVQATASAAPAKDVQRIIELYIAFFNRVPDADGLSYWIGQKSAGQSINSIADTFYDAGVQFSSVTGFNANMTNANFVNLIYKNVLGRTGGADAGGLNYWTGKLADGSASRGTLVSSILDSAHTFKGDATLGWVANLLDNKIEVAKAIAINWGLGYADPNTAITNGMAIATAITPVDTLAALKIVGIAGTDLQLG